MIRLRLYNFNYLFRKRMERELLEGAERTLRELYSRKFMVTVTMRDGSQISGFAEEQNDGSLFFRLPENGK